MLLFFCFFGSRGSWIFVPWAGHVSNHVELPRKFPPQLQKGAWEMFHAIRNMLILNLVAFLSQAPSGWGFFFLQFSWHIFWQLWPLYTNIVCWLLGGDCHASLPYCLQAQRHGPWGGRGIVDDKKMLLSADKMYRNIMEHTWTYLYYSNK